MKYIGRKSLSSFLKAILNIFWGLGLLTLLMLTISSIYSIFIVYKGVLNTIWTIGVLLIVGGILFIIYNLRKILQTLIKENPFSAKNISRFRHIGYTTLIISILLLFNELYFHGLKTFTIIDVGEGGIDTNIALFIPFISGIFSLILAEVFRIAYQIDEENKLTI